MIPITSNELTRLDTSTDKWPTKPFSVPIHTPTPTYCILFFDNLGTRAGTPDESTTLLSMIISQLGIWRSQGERGGPLAFYTSIERAS